MRIPLKTAKFTALAIMATTWTFSSATSGALRSMASPTVPIQQRPDILSSDYYRLEEDLLQNYKPHIRPVHSYRTATNVSLDVEVVSVEEVNEGYQTLRHSSWLSMTWTDQFLTWDPDDYDGLDVIELPDDTIWTPSLHIGNSVFESREGGNFARVHFNGTVIAGPMSMKETLCSLDITFYPFDTQKCGMVINLWSSPESEVHLNIVEARTDPFFFTENSQWKLTDLTVLKQPNAFHGEKYSHFHVFLHLRRRRLFHCLTLIVPNVLLALLAGLVFALPQECGEKMSFSMSLLLAFAVNLSVLVTAMPRSSLQVSLLMIYLTSLSVVTALSVVTTVFLLRLYHKVGVVGPKVTAFTFFLRKLRGLEQPHDVIVKPNDAHRRHDGEELRREGQIFSTFSQNDKQEKDFLANESMSPDVINVSSINRLEQKINGSKLAEGSKDFHIDPATLTWKAVAVTLDRICFRIFVVVIVGMTSALVVALFVGQE